MEEKAEELLQNKLKYNALKTKLDQKRENMLATDKTISKLNAERDELSQQHTDSEIESKKLEHKIERFHKDKKDASKFVEHLEKKYTWIKTEKQ